jgi:p-hydroxybenzoate 3-monooxygenase
VSERTQVAIIGGGPAGMLLSHMLDLEGVANVVIEKQTRSHVLKRIRAGVLEYGTVKLLRDVGLGERLDVMGRPHDGTLIVWEDQEPFLIDTNKYTGRQLTAYGQTYITEDLYAARDRSGAEIIEDVSDVVLHDLTSAQPAVSFTGGGRQRRIACDFIAGCDGFHGVSRRSIPASVLHTFERTYPFGWLGIMAETPPLEHIVYAQHSRGFALASQRSSALSRYYIQCDPGASVDDWSDDRFWDELKARLPAEFAARVVTGPSIEKSIAPLRSFVAEPMRYGALFLAGDAAHIVPPTGAKGLNLAVSDVYYLHRALTQFYRSNDRALLDAYSETALQRVWGAERLSWWLTQLLHVFPGQDGFTTKVNLSEYLNLQRSERAHAALAEQYIGLPL